MRTIHLVLSLILSLTLLCSMAVGGENPLPREKAFGFKSTSEAHAIHVSFDMPEGYHLYRERLKIQPGSDQVRLGRTEIPEGEWADDPTHGRTRVLRHHVDIRIPIEAIDPNPETNIVKLSYQGCQDQGSCYPPHREHLSLAGIEPAPAPSASSVASECGPDPDAGTLSDQPSEQCAAFNTLRSASFIRTTLSFLGMGVLLAFTPCIFPMIPILSGIIAGQGSRLRRWEAFWLSLAYVLASALAYTGFGVIAGLFGKNLQATLQHPGVIISFSALFLVLALSMFGLFTFQLPGTLQGHLTALSTRQKGGTLLGAAIMGFLSALIVGPCVAAPLAGALIYIGETGDALLGGAALFALGLGMGLPLLAIGTSAGSLLPKAGAWMDQIKAVFGFGLIGVGIQLLGRLLPAEDMLYLWGGFLMLAAMALGALEPLGERDTLGLRLSKGIGLIALVYGSLLLVGGALGSGELMRPLSHLSLSSSGGAPSRHQALGFEKITSLPELQNRLHQAEMQNQPVLLDFYADWCTSCKEMESITFRDPEVISALSNVLLLKADVTEVTDTHLALLREFGLIGPPATLLFRANGEEARSRRVLGFMDPPAFTRQIKSILDLQGPSS